MSQNQLGPIRPLCYRQIFPNTVAMNSAQLNKTFKLSGRQQIVAQKEVDFPNIWCSDLQYITSASTARPSVVSV